LGELKVAVLRPAEQDPEELVEELMRVDGTLPLSVNKENYCVACMLDRAERRS